MCMYDRSADKAEDKCQTVEDFERDLAKGDELIKCGGCYGTFNIFPRVDDVDECSAVGTDVIPCGTEKKNGEWKYPMCIWDASKNEPKSKCETLSKMEYHLTKKSEKGEDDMLLACGFCDKINFFEKYGWKPPVPPAEIDGCDWDTMDTCKDQDNRYPMCIWDDKKRERKSKCEKVSKLNSMKSDEYLVGCGYCEDIVL